MLTLLLVLGACTSQNSPKTIYIVRHAEKQLVGNDPQLAYAGEVRAKRLAQILQDQEIKHVFSTDYARTKNTGKPTADAEGLTIEIYDPKNQEAFAEQLRKIEGNSLIIGHSNTVSELANFFTGDGEKFEDLTDLEYDFIYVITLERNSASVVRKVYQDF